MQLQEPPDILVKAYSWPLTHRLHLMKCQHAIHWGNYQNNLSTAVLRENARLRNILVFKFRWSQPFFSLNRGSVITATKERIEEWTGEERRQKDPASVVGGVLISPCVQGLSATTFLHIWWELTTLGILYSTWSHTSDEMLHGEKCSVKTYPREELPSGCWRSTSSFPIL